MITESNSSKTLIRVLIAVLAAMIIGIFVFKGVRAAQNRSVSGMQVTVYSVGKGDCILVEQEDHAMLIDCGYEETAGEITDYLKLMKTDIESVIITHYDRDHVGGASAFADSFGSADFYLPDYEGSSAYYRALMNSLASPDRSGSSQRVSQDVSFMLGDASVTIYASGIGFDGDNDNDCSLVVSVLYGDDSYLFTGDLEKEGIAAFLEKHAQQWDVIKMPHHGNKKAGAADLLASVKPRLAIITDGDSDQASGEVLDILNKARVKTYRTAQMGTFYIKSDGKRNYVFEQAI